MTYRFPIKEIARKAGLGITQPMDILALAVPALTLENIPEPFSSKKVARSSEIAGIEARYGKIPFASTSWVGTKRS